MNKKSILFIVLSVFLIINSVKCWAHNDQQRSHYLSSKSQFNEEVFVDVFGDGKYYYDATISSTFDKLIVSIIDQELENSVLTFKTGNCIQFIDAYKNYIIVKEVNDDGDVLSYWVVSIVYDKKRDEYFLDSFPVNSRQNDEFYDMTAGKYELTEILQYDEKNQWLAVLFRGDTPAAWVVYKINVGQKINVFLTVSVLLDAGYDIRGGNLKVLYDYSKDQFLVSTNNCRATLQDVTIFDKVSICDLTKLPLYSKGGRIYSLVGSYFEYVSKSSDQKSFTAFLYSGYGDKSIQGQVNLKSNSPIKYLYDNYNFFVAITHCDIYLSNVYWDNDKNTYKTFTNTLSDTVSSDKKREEILKEWGQALQIIFLDENFYILTKNRFLVYGTGKNYFTKLYENDCTSSLTKNSDLDEALLKQIKLYRNKTEKEYKSKWHN